MYKDRDASRCDGGTAVARAGGSRRFFRESRADGGSNMTRRNKHSGRGRRIEPLEPRRLMAVGGSLDPSFGGDAKVTLSTGETLYPNDIAVQADGRSAHRPRTIGRRGELADHRGALMEPRRRGRPASIRVRRRREQHAAEDAKVATLSGTVSTAIDEYSMPSPSPRCPPAPRPAELAKRGSVPPVPGSFARLVTSQVTSDLGRDRFANRGLQSRCAQQPHCQRT
jgi:hypothetical protein